MSEIQLAEPLNEDFKVANMKTRVSLGINFEKTGQKN